MSSTAENVAWLVENHAESTPGVRRVVAVSSDGLVMATAGDVARADADRLAAIVSGLRSLADGAARVMGDGRVRQVVVEMDDAYLLVAAVAEGAALGVVAAADCDLGLVGYETTLLVDRVGRHLSPEVVAELRTRLVR